MKLLRRTLYAVGLLLLTYVFGYWYLFMYHDIRPYYRTAYLGTSPIKQLKHDLIIGTIDFYRPARNFESDLRTHLALRPYLGDWQTADGSSRLTVDPGGKGQLHYHAPGPPDESAAYAFTLEKYYEDTCFRIVDIANVHLRNAELIHLPGGAHHPEPALLLQGRTYYRVR